MCYMNKLSEYVGKKIDCSIDEKKIEIFADAEIYYILDKRNTQYILSMSEKGVETKLTEFYSSEEMQRSFPFWMRGLLGNSVDYSDVSKFEDVDDLEVLERLLKQYTHCNLYSINQMSVDKIVLNLIEGDNYEVAFVDKTQKKHLIEQRGKAPFIFERFYTEIVHYREMLKRLEKYTSIFGDKLSYENKLQLLGYSQ